MSAFLEKVSKSLPGIELLREEPMSKHTTFRIGGPAEYYACPTDSQIAALIAIARECGIRITVIGNGSNLLVADEGIRGLVIEIGAGMGEIKIKGDRLIAGAGALLSRAANAAAEAGLSGMEFAAGIPGSVGGAVTMNAGAYGGEMKDIIESATVLTPSGELKTLSLAELDLSYRHSCIPDGDYIVLSAVMSLKTDDKRKIRERMEELRGKRVAKQPLEYPSAGSTFKRPEGYFAGKLIMDANLRGYTVGGAQVSEKHCGFVINRGGATAAEVRQLMSDVQAKVEAQSGVRLEPEVKMVGDYK